MQMLCYWVNFYCQELKHIEFFVVDGFREGNGIEITSKDEDYVPNPREMSSDEDSLVEVDVNSGSSDNISEFEAIKFDDSADDGDHEDHFEENDEGENIQFNEARNSNSFGRNNHPNNSQLDHNVGEISLRCETDFVESFDGDSDDAIKKDKYPPKIQSSRDECRLAVASRIRIYFYCSI